MEKSRAARKKEKVQQHAPLRAKNLTVAAKADRAAGARVTTSGSRSKSPAIPKPAAVDEFEFISTSRSRQKRTRVAEALRGEGFDEDALGRAYVKLARKLFAGKKASGNDKLLVDVLKEISRTLEPPNPGGGASSASGADGPMIVQLLHEVPRPVRNVPGDAPDGTSGERLGDTRGGSTFDDRRSS